MDSDSRLIKLRRLSGSRRERTLKICVKSVLNLVRISQYRALVHQTTFTNGFLFYLYTLPTISGLDCFQCIFKKHMSEAFSTKVHNNIQVHFIYVLFLIPFYRNLNGGGRWDYLLESLLE